MLEGGFILLHRSILRWEWYGDLNTARLFIHLLLTVNYEPQRWQGIAVERGQRVASLAKLADETGLTVKQVRTALEHLKRTGEVTHTATSKYGLFTVNHYDRYQPRGEPEGTRPGMENGIQGAGGGQANVIQLLRYIESHYNLITDFQYCLHSNVLIDAYVKQHQALFEKSVSDFLEKA